MALTNTKKILRNTGYALLGTALISCASTSDGERDEYENTKKNAGIGAAVGAVAGALVAGDNTQGALLGGALGAAAGGAYGNKLDKQAAELEKIAETKRTDQGIVTKLKGDLTFDTGKSTLKGDGQQRIKEMADILKKYPENNITIVGHTDSTGSNQINQQLSQERASSVKNLLVQNGVPSASINAMGVGPTDPIADNSTATGREANRRVELAITMGEQKAAE